MSNRLCRTRIRSPNTVAFSNYIYNVHNQVRTLYLPVDYAAAVVQGTCGWWRGVWVGRGGRWEGERGVRWEVGRTAVCVAGWMS